MGEQEQGHLTDRPAEVGAFLWRSARISAGSPARPCRGLCLGGGQLLWMVGDPQSIRSPVLGLCLLGWRDWTVRWKKENITVSSLRRGMTTENSALKIIRCDTVILQIHSVDHDFLKAFISQFSKVCQLLLCKWENLRSRGAFPCTPRSCTVLDCCKQVAHVNLNDCSPLWNTMSLELGPPHWKVTSRRDR